MSKEKSKVLIVEDDPLLLDLYETKLTQEGFVVFTATNGKLGYEQAVAHEPELILLDVLMPEVDGYEMLKAVKDNPKTQKTPVIIFSNLSQREEVEKGMKLGADDFIVKTSLTPLQLAQKVKTYF